MGGYGSGRQGWRPHLESAFCLNLIKLRKWGYLKTGCLVSGKLTWDFGGDVYEAQIQTSVQDWVGSISIRHELRGEQRIDLRASPARFGGRRWWMICPYTWRRALKLYLFNGIPKFCCRLAIKPRPTYASQRVSGKDRVFERRWAIRRRLGDDGSLLDPLSKPKGMRWKTFERYEAKEAMLEQQDLGYFLARFGGLLNNGS